ncbi:hypothetical protein P171DRAFT_430632 [Karstenula rhodostoma CBS 690.94]|uniref:HPP transmembrane region domain-containing protein n=1 Tax=Karstenula rhodostoma CBS 690.94 TaxID=1392251 RepID=A0A9P4UER5_9PLEO|nr:hypothetical protein P171DRAFT_430632 [Karstenula rhodostoma CBS 690.94]
MAFFHKAEAWNIDVDRYVNRIVPPSPLHRLPPPISRFLGYRKQQKEDVGNILGAFWSLLGAFCGLAVVAAVFNNTKIIQMHHPPALIASYGASAILEYNAIRSPLGQPRNALLGHTFSAIIGVGITKLFRLRSDFEKVQWIAGAVSCGTASAVMLLTGTVHPPGGASAVLAATSPEIIEMGWYFVPLIMFGATLMLIVGLIIMNIERQFPVYWWTPLPLRVTRKRDVEIGPDGAGGLEERNEDLEEKESDEKLSQITISPRGITLPETLALSSEETELLERLRNRLAKGSLGSSQHSISSGSSANMTMVPSHGALDH